MSSIFDDESECIDYYNNLITTAIIDLEKYCIEEHKKKIDKKHKHLNSLLIKNMNKIELTEELYTKNIPKNCAYQTLEQHKEMLLCWGLASSIENNKPMNCGICDLNIDNKTKNNE